MRSTLMVLATTVSISLLACGVAVADIVTTDFENFALGSVDEQFGWHSAEPGDVPALPNGYDQAVVSSGGAAGFGTQSLRHSNAYSENTGEFEFQTYSASNAVNAGEAALPANTAFIGKFQFTSTSDELQDRLKMSISPDNGHGGRMSYISLVDTPAGINATFYDTVGDGNFRAFPAGVYSRDGVHTVTFLLELVPGPANDIVHVVIDGADIGNELGACFTTWENFYRATEQAVPVTNSLQFRSDNGRAGNPGLVIDHLVGRGYLFDNVSTDTAPAADAVPACGEEPPPIDVDKTTTTRVAERGTLVTYRISVRNRGDAPVRGVRVCDRAPRALRFVRSRARLHRASGRRRCLTVGRLRAGQRRTFRATFRLRANVTAQSVTNDATVDVPSGSTPSPTPPDSTSPSPSPPGTAALPAQKRRRVARDNATIGVQGENAACPAALPPRARAAC